MTNARCSRGGSLVVLGLGPRSYTGKRWSLLQRLHQPVHVPRRHCQGMGRTRTCRDLVATFRDGTTRRARFTFTK